MVEVNGNIINIDGSSNEITITLTGAASIEIEKLRIGTVKVKQ